MGAPIIEGLKNGAHPHFKTTFAKSAANAKGRPIPNLAGEGNIPRQGLTAVLSVKVPDPEFEGQTKNNSGKPPRFVAIVWTRVVGESLDLNFWNSIPR